MDDIVSSFSDSVRTIKGSIPTWQESIKRAIRDPVELCQALDLPSETATSALRSSGSFGVFVPREFLLKMKRGDLNDPLLRQILPMPNELDPQPNFSDDPVGDGSAMLLPGLLQKYNQRVLLVTTGACAIHCRYCFRREFPYSETPPDIRHWMRAVKRIAKDTSIREVLLSGGDPLTIRDGLLAQLVNELSHIPHLRRLRLHTRLPIVIPQRVTHELVGWLRSTRLTPIMVVHVNHPAELGDDVISSLSYLVDHGIPVLNQAVLLRGINDDLNTLTSLCETLVDARVIPYYLHQLDRVTGTAHFEVSVDRGQQLIKQLRERLPGYAVPQYVAELPGATSKTVLV